MSARHVFLIGFMGSGKTTVARIVASAIGRPCVDLDEEIERALGMSVADAFVRLGEPGFRAAEHDALAALATAEPGVVACGGGVVIDPRNRALLHELGLVVYLEVSAAEALARIGDTASRPLLAGSSGALAATTLLSARESLYAATADVRVDTSGSTPEEVAAVVTHAIQEAAS